MIKQLIINNKKSYDDFGVYIASRKISSPKKKVIKETVPFTNKVYDFSKINGELYWEERTLEYSFDIAEITTEEMEVVKSKLLSWLLNVHDTDIYDPYIGDYHFHGSYDSDSWEEDFGAGTISVSFSVYPYKISNSDINVTSDELGISTDGTLENSVDGFVRGLTINGKSEQETRSGKNFFNKDLTQLFTNGVTVTKLDTGIRVVLNVSSQYRYGCFSIPNSSNLLGKTITISASVVTSASNDGSIRLYYIDDSGNLKDSIKIFKATEGIINGNVTIPASFPEGATQICLLLYANSDSTTSSDGDYVDYVNLQIEEGTVATEYEAYGVSPSPEFPSEIQSVGDEGTVEIKQTGKNLLNPVGQNDQAKGMTFVNNGDGSFTLSGTSTGATSFALTDLNNFPMRLYKGKTYTQSLIVLAGTKDKNCAVVPAVKDSEGNISWNYLQDNQTKVADKDYSFYAYTIYINGGATVNLTFKVQLEEGKVATEYEQYKGNNYVISLSQPLRSLPNGVCDTIEEDGIHRRVGSIVLDGNEAWLTHPYGTNSFQIPNIIDINYKSNETQIISNNFKGVSNDDRSMGGSNIIYSTSKVSFVIRNTEFTTIEEFKSCLSTNNTEVLYELAEEIIEPFDEEQQAVIDSMQTYGGITHINLNTDLETTFEVKYNEKENITIINNSSHRVPVTLISSGNFTITTLSNLGKNLLNVDKNLILDDMYGINVNIPIGTYKVSFSSESHNGANYPYLRFYNNNVWIMLYANRGEQLVNLSKDETKIYLYTNGMNALASKGVNAIINQLMISKEGGEYEPYRGIKSSYSVGEGIYTNGVYLEQGENDLDIVGSGKITFSYSEEVF